MAKSDTLYKYSAFLEKVFPSSPEAMEDEGIKKWIEADVSASFPGNKLPLSGTERC